MNTRRRRKRTGGKKEQFTSYFETSICSTAIRNSCQHLTPSGLSTINHAERLHVPATSQPRSYWIIWRHHARGERYRYVQRLRLLFARYLYMKLIERNKSMSVNYFITNSLFKTRLEGLDKLMTLISNNEITPPSSNHYW